MSHLSYDDLLGAFPRPHVVIGVVEHLRRVQIADDTIINLIAALRPKGDWATSRRQDGPFPVVHCVFARRSDADRLAGAVQAITVDGVPGFASWREFRLGGEARRRITQALRDLAR